MMRPALTKKKTKTMKMSNTFRETFVTYETFDQTDEETWLDQQKDKDIKRTSSKSNPRNTHETPITFLTLENYNFNIHCHPVCYNLHERMMTAQWYRPIHFLFLRLSLDPNIHGPWSQSSILTGFLYPVFFMLDPQFWSLILILSLLSCPLT